MKRTLMLLFACCSLATTALATQTNVVAEVFSATW